MCFKIIASPLNKLGSHPEGGTDKGIPLRLDIGELRSHTKVGQLDFAGLRQKDIGGLYIPVHLALGMEVFQPQQQLPADDGNERF